MSSTEVCCKLSGLFLFRSSFLLHTLFSNIFFLHFSVKIVVVVTLVKTYCFTVPNWQRTIAVTIVRTYVLKTMCSLLDTIHSLPSTQWNLFPTINTSSSFFFLPSLFCIYDRILCSFPFESVINIVDVCIKSPNDLLNNCYWFS